MSTVLAVAQALMRCRSITPDDAGCQQLIADYLKPLGFTLAHLPFGTVSNLWAWRGEQSPRFVFVGHTDVVPPGPLEKWQSDPFVPTVRNGYLFGRGAADMKGGIAAMLVACEEFIQQCPEHRGSIGFLITSDEEGPAVNGTTKVVEYLQAQQTPIDWCLVGEPTSESWVGDTIKNGRRGSLTGKLVVRGKQGHIAYPHLAANPIHKLAPALNDLVSIKWDEGNEFFQPTSLQIAQINAGAGATNVIPGEATVLFNFRFAPVSTEASLKQRVHAVLEHYRLDYTLDWLEPSKPYLTQPGALVSACQHAVKAVMGETPKLSTSGGTSDGRFIAEMGAQVVELGVLNKTIHQIDECVAVADLEKLKSIYLEVLMGLFASAA